MEQPRTEAGTIKMISISQAAHIDTKTFNNRKYIIKIERYEHNMARVWVEYKRHNPTKKGRRFAYAPLDECKVESMSDYMECLECLDEDKVAGRWFMREVRFYTADFLLADGRIDWERARAVDESRRTEK